MHNRTWYEVRTLSGSTSHNTKEEAKKELEAMKSGYPENVYMTPENKEYWKNASQHAEIYRVEESFTKI